MTSPSPMDGWSMTQPLLQDWKGLRPLTTVIVVMFSLVNVRECVSRTECGVEKLLHAMVNWWIELVMFLLFLLYSHHLSTSWLSLWPNNLLSKHFPILNWNTSNVHCHMPSWTGEEWRKWYENLFEWWTNCCGGMDWDCSQLCRLVEYNWYFNNYSCTCIIFLLQCIHCAILLVFSRELWATVECLRTQIM